MYRTTIFFCSLIVSGLAFGDWKKITTGFRSTAYADIESIRKNGDITAMNVLIDFEKAPFDGNNLPYLSLKMAAEYNCRERQFRAVEVVSHEGRMATGNTPYTSEQPGNWESIPDKSLQKALWETACGKR